MRLPEYDLHHWGRPNSLQPPRGNAAAIQRLALPSAIPTLRTYGPCPASFLAPAGPVPTADCPPASGQYSMRSAPDAAKQQGGSRWRPSCARRRSHSTDGLEGGSTSTCNANAFNTFMRAQQVSSTIVNAVIQHHNAFIKPRCSCRAPTMRHPSTAVHHRLAQIKRPPIALLVHRQHCDPAPLPRMNAAARACRPVSSPIHNLGPPNLPTLPETCNRRLDEYDLLRLGRRATVQRRTVCNHLGVVLPPRHPTTHTAVYNMTLICDNHIVSHNRTS